MRIFILILVILSILGLLESQSIIPQSPYSILGAMSSAAVFIRSLNIQSYYLIIPDIVNNTSRYSQLITDPFYSRILIRELQRSRAK